MHKNITRFARAGNCGSLGAKGFVFLSSRVLVAGMVAADASDENARYPKPDDIV
jgi:hypothetical protein